MIRKEIKQDGTFGGNYPSDINYINLPENLIEVTREKAQEIDNNLDKYRFIEGQITDISSTPEYIAEQALKAKEQANAEIQKQINELDIKRIRAIAEPSQKTTNQSWLEFYTGQIQALRAQLNF